MSEIITNLAREYPFAKELIANTDGRVSKVVLDYRNYQRLLAQLEDVGLARAMKGVAHEKPLRREQALKVLERP